MNREQKFFNALRDVFVGAKIEGESGYINLMRIKSRYYTEGVFPKLQHDINEALKPFPGFRDELFEKLYDFFHRYFSESGSIYFRYTPLHQNVYEKVYTDDKDVMLFWKTHMLYYVKTDRLFKSMEAEVDGQKFFFDVAALEHKRANEKRDIVYAFKEKRKDGTLVFTVAYSERGKKTKTDDILKTLRKNGDKINEDTLERAFRIFEKQSEVDYFINKDAKAFLEEQFNLWLYQYVFSGVSEWTEIRIKQLQTLRDIAFKIIAFISQFENELVKIWNKPKFVLNSNYVITLDRIAEKDIALVEKLLAHKNFKAQVEEWQQLGIMDDSFTKSVVLEKDGKGKRLAKLYQHLPIDTKHFKDVELEILGLFDNLDASIDGWLVKSENYQALKTALPKYTEKVKCAYVDPPYNTGSDEFKYKDKYQHSSWLTMMHNRAEIASSYLGSGSTFAVQISDIEDSKLKEMLGALFPNGFINRITVRTKSPSGFQTVNVGVFETAEYIFLHAKEKEKVNYNPQFVPTEYDTNYNRYVENISDDPTAWTIQALSGVVADTLGFKNPREAVKKLGRGAFREKLGDFALDHCESVFRYTEIDDEGAGQETVRIKQLSIKSPDKIFVHKRKGYNDRLIQNGQEITFYSKKVREIEGEKIPTVPVTNIWTDISWEGIAKEGGVTLKQGKKPERLLGRIVDMTSSPRDVVMDFFVGTGTTCAVSQKKNRRWLGVEVDPDLFAQALDRLRRVLSGEMSGISKSIGWLGGGFIKYYELEQYEDVLRRAKYCDADLFDDPNKDPYHQYVFLRDLKMLEALEVDTKKNTVEVDLSKLYDGIDIAETLSNLTGKWIKRITADSVEFEDGEVVDTKNLDWRRIKPLIWW